MRGRFDTASGIWLFRVSWRSGGLSSSIFLIVFLARAALAPLPVAADGCFVFKWDKNADINEPTQKAIVVHDAGREDLLLQVKYEGPLEDFGWLIPVPSLPKVSRGSMEPFYELSKLTQRQFAMPYGDATLDAMSAFRRRGGPEETVSVIEVKTVGEYEVSVLSAKESGSLARWLQEHGYSIPNDGDEIVNEYVRKGWYFVAARIQLNKESGSKARSGTTAISSEPSDSIRNALQKQLSSGELHPLLISFDTPRCVFPLRISAVGGKPSEVSLYVLSAEPLLERFTFGKACEKLSQSAAEWARQRPALARSHEVAMQNSRRMTLAASMNNLDPLQRKRSGPQWTAEDLNALAAESLAPISDQILGYPFHASPDEMLQEMRIERGKIPQCAKILPRLKGRRWHLTKLAWNFTPAEMQDLGFEPAIPVLARVLTNDYGSVAAQLLAQLDPDGQKSLRAALGSSNPTERINAVIGFGRAHTNLPNEEILTLLKDKEPQVRLFALDCGPLKWNPPLADALIELLRDPYSEIRVKAVRLLCDCESTNRTPVYLALLRDPDAQVRTHALAVADWINRYAPSEVVFRAALAFLKDPSEDVRYSSLRILQKSRRRDIPKASLLPLLQSARGGTVMAAANLLRDLGLKSAEAAPLMTNRLGNVRLLGLRVMAEKGDAKAIELSLPLLRDPNSLIRCRAHAVLQAISGQKMPDDDPAEWEAWWTANKATFKPRRSP